MPTEAIGNYVIKTLAYWVEVFYFLMVQGCLAFTVICYANTVEVDNIACLSGMSVLVISVQLSKQS